MELKNFIFKFFFIIIFINIESNSFALTKNKIIANVEDQIISSYELKNEIKTILFLSDQDINQKNIDIAKKQAMTKLINYKLKKNQIIKFNIQSDNSAQVNNYLKNLSSKYKTDINGIKKIFKNKDLDFEIYLDEIETEFNWQKLIFHKFKDKIVLNDEEISKELKDFIKTQSNLMEYKLAEIEIPLKNNSEDKSTILEINNQINEIGFEKTAIKYSISTSSLDGGNIGWINSRSLSKKILDLLNEMNINDISQPIIQTNTATILKLLDKKTIDIKNTDIDKLKKRLVKAKRNELLNLYSNNYLSKLRNNALIEIR